MLAGSGTAQGLRYRQTISEMYDELSAGCKGKVIRRGGRGYSLGWAGLLVKGESGYRAWLPAIVVTTRVF